MGLSSLNICPIINIIIAFRAFVFQLLVDPGPFLVDVLRLITNSVQESQAALWGWTDIGNPTL